MNIHRIHVELDLDGLNVAVMDLYPTDDPVFAQAVQDAYQRYLAAEPERIKKLGG